MNKYMLIGSIFFMTQANAVYMVNIPLEEDRGGFLPNNSILFISNTTPPTAPGGTECQYDYTGNPAYYAFERVTHEVSPGVFRYTDAAYWNQQQVVYNEFYVGPQLTEYTYNGYTYTFTETVMETNQINTNTTNAHEVCRTPI